MSDLRGRYEFRSIRPEEGEEAADIELICFPPNEACSREATTERAKKAPEFFIVAKDKETGKIAGSLTGLATAENAFRDEFFVNADLNDPKGKYIMLLSLCVRPEYRGQGLARELMTEYIRREKANGRSRLYLTCLDDKVKMYSKMGYKDLGISGSVWGGQTWHDMSYDIKS